MRKIIIIGLLLLGIAGMASAQNCTSCSITISSAWASPIAAPAGTVICVTPSGSISGDILISGGTVCNEGVISSHNILMTGGTLLNYGSMDVVNLSSNSGCVFENNAVAFIDSLSQQGAVVSNDDSLVVLAHSVFDQSSFQNTGFYASANTSIFNSSNGVNSGIFNCDHLSVYLEDSVVHCNFENSLEGVLESDSISVWNAHFANWGSMFVHFDMSLWEVAQFGNMEYCRIDRDFFIDSLSWASTNCMIHIGGDFFNLGTVYGPPSGCGGFAVEGLTGNAGVFGAYGLNLDLCDASNPGSFDLNTGTLGSGVTFCVCTDTCEYNVGVGEPIDSPKTSVRVYPNPADEFLNIEIDSQEGSLAEISMINAMGTRVMTEIICLVQGNQIVKFDTKHLSPGFYLINIQTDTEFMSIKVIK